MLLLFILPAMKLLIISYFIFTDIIVNRNIFKTELLSS